MNFSLPARRRALFRPILLSLAFFGLAGASPAQTITPRARGLDALVRKTDSTKEKATAVGTGPATSTTGTSTMVMPRLLKSPALISKAASSTDPATKVDPIVTLPRKLPIDPKKPLPTTDKTTRGGGLMDAARLQNKLIISRLTVDLDAVKPGGAIIKATIHCASVATAGTEVKGKLRVYLWQKDHWAPAPIWDRWTPKESYPPTTVPIDIALKPGASVPLQLLPNRSAAYLLVVETTATGAQDSKQAKTPIPPPRAFMVKYRLPEWAQEVKTAGDNADRLIDSARAKAKSLNEIGYQTTVTIRRESDLFGTEHTVTLRYRCVDWIEETFNTVRAADALVTRVFELAPTTELFRD